MADNDQIALKIPANQSLDFSGFLASLRAVRLWRVLIDGLINKGVHAALDDLPKPKKGAVYGHYVAGIAYGFETY